MSLQPAIFLDAFEGKWDGHEREIHGLVERDGTSFKIEILPRTGGRYLISVFAEGAVRFSDLTSNPVETLEDFWRDD